MTIPYEKYVSGEYGRDNPSWDATDSPWKAEQISGLLNRNRIRPATVVEVGCGAGGVLGALASKFPSAYFSGYDIAPDASQFWHQHAGDSVHFEVGDFTSIPTEKFDLLLLLDVIEHVADPFAFLCALRHRAEYFAFHIPLDLSSASVLREAPLLYVRRKVGHIHYFTKGLALALLDECGFSVIDSQYTGASLNAPERNWKTRLAAIPRRIIRATNEDFGVRLFGGETLIVLARGNR
jgi:SAM-dependent methyltransferase